MKKALVRSIGVLGLMALTVGGCSKSVRPTSYQADIVESLDGDRVRVAALGIGKETQEALTDAYRAAVYRVSQDLVQSQEERIGFEGAQDELYEKANQFVLDYTIKSRRKEPKGDVKLNVDLVLNRKRLSDELVALGVIKTQRQLLSELRNPSIAVLPEDKSAREAWARFATDRATSYLTTRKFEVLDAGQVQKIDGMVAQTQAVSGEQSDRIAQIALQLGSDIYLVYDLNLSRGKVGKDGTVKASASVRAFETTTARAIGSATGFSREYASTAGSDEKVIAEALSDAVDRVLVNIMDYWKDDAIKGFQYLVQVRGDFSGEGGRKARRALYTAMKDSAGDLKENLATEETLNYRIWFKGSNTDLLFKLQDDFESATGKRLRSISQNRKLLQLKVE